MYKFLLSTIFLSILVLSSCSSDGPNALTESDAEAFLQRVELEDKTLGPIVSSAYWIGDNFITYDSQKVVADYGKRYQLLALERARQASSFDGVLVSEKNRRKLNLIKSSFVMPSPLNEELAGEISSISASLDAMYGTGQHCFADDECYFKGSLMTQDEDEAGAAQVATIFGDGSTTDVLTINDPHTFEINLVSLSTTQMAVWGYVVSDTVAAFSAAD